MTLESPLNANNESLLNRAAIEVLLRENATIFQYDYGTKQVNLSWDQRRKRIIKSTGDLKPFNNYHIITGEGNFSD